MNKIILLFAVVAATAVAAPIPDPAEAILIAPDYIVKLKSGGMYIENKVTYEKYKIIPQWIIGETGITRLTFTESDIYIGKYQTIGVTKNYRNSTLAFNLEMQGSKLLITTSINNWDFKNTKLTLVFKFSNICNRTILAQDNTIHLDGFLTFKLDNHSYTESGMDRVKIKYIGGLYYITFPKFNQTLYHFSELSFEHGIMDIIFMIYVIIALLAMRLCMPYKNKEN